MQCRACNTRVSRTNRTCPNCGLNLSNASSGSGQDPASSRSQKLGPSSAADPVEVELDERVRLGKERPRRKRTGSVGTGPVQRVGRSERRDQGDSRAGRSSSGADPRVSPQQLRNMLIAEPTMIEAGLRTFEEDGTPVGAGYLTDVGEIDLLAVDAAAGLLVVMVDEGDKGADLVADVLQRIGWIRKHLAERGQEVRGLVLVESAPEDLGYAAAAVAGTVAFKTYRLAVSFDDLLL